MGGCTQLAMNPAGPVDAELADLLRRALADEREAAAYFQAVIDKHGEVRPFSKLVHAERRHAAALERVIKAYGIDVPPADEQAADEQPAPRVPDSLAAAAAKGAQEEQANVDLLDEVLKRLDDESARLAVTNLRDASAQRHLPALQRAAGR